MFSELFCLLKQNSKKLNEQPDGYETIWKKITCLKDLFPPFQNPVKLLLWSGHGHK